MGMTYTYEDAKYDVEKLSVEGQQVFKILAVAQRKADELDLDDTIRSTARNAGSLRCILKCRSI